MVAGVGDGTGLVEHTLDVFLECNETTLFSWSEMQAHVIFTLVYI